MAGAKRATIANEVGRSIDALVLGATDYLPDPSFTVRSLDHEVEKLFKADAFSASLKRGLLYQLYGSAKDAIYWIDNARKLRSDPTARLVTDATEAVISSNLGHFSQASRLLIGLGKESWRGEVILLFLCGAWSELSELEDVALEPPVDEASAKAVATARRCFMTLQQVGVTQAQVQAMLDVAGEVLREHRMFFLGDQPIVRECDDVVLYQLRVPAQPVEALAMTDEVIERLVDRDLDAAGLAFSFLPG